MNRQINRWLWLGLAILCLILVPAAQAQQTPPLPVDDYWQLLQDTQSVVSSVADPPSEADLARLAEAGERLKGVTAVTLPNGSTIPVNQSFLATKLQASPPDVEQINQLLASQLAARQTWLQSGRQSADTAVLREILAQPQFQWPEQELSPIRQWLNDLIERLREFLRRFQREGSDGRITIPNLSNILTWGGAILLALVLFYSLRGLFQDFVADAELQHSGGANALPLTADSAFNRAQNLSSSGDYRTAVRYLYLSLLLMLEERGLLRYDRSKTNREYLRSVAQQPELAATLRDIIDVFDRVWYGFQTLDETAYARYAAQVKDLQKRR
jgi:hypothetical protein